MPTDLENAKLMLLCLQYSTATAFDYQKIGEECNISAGAASKRMSRLKQAVKEGKDTGLDVRYLWSCIQHSDMDNINFKTIGEELGLNAGAASKRWSRLKLALERGETGSSGPANGGAVRGKAGASGKKGAAGGRKRQNSEAMGNEEPNTTNAKKAKKNTSTRKPKGRETSNDDGKVGDILPNEANVAAFDTTDTDETVAMTDKKPVHTHNKAAATDPKPSMGPIGTITPGANSAPPVRRRRKPLTDEEIYEKLNVDEVEQLEMQKLKPGFRAYPKRQILLESFQAARSPAGSKKSASASSPTDVYITSPNSNAFDDITVPGEDAPLDNFAVHPTDPSPADKNRAVQKVFNAISEEAMKSPSGAEKRLKKKVLENVFSSTATDDSDQQTPAKDNSTNGIDHGNHNSHNSGSTPINSSWYQVPQNLPNPFFNPMGDESFFSGAGDEPGEGEEYC